MERNVRAVMELARVGEAGPLPRARVQQLYRKGEDDIRIALEPFGRYQPAIEKSLSESKQRWIARYQIDPGPAVLVKTINLTMSGAGADAPEFKRAAAEFPLHPGDTLLHVAYEAGKLMLLKTASDSGYLDARFDTSTVVVDREKGTADVALAFSTGQRFRFGPVQFEQKTLSESFLRSRIPFKQGQPWRQDKVTLFQTSLAADPYWTRVEVVPERAKADSQSLEVPIRVVLEPRKPLSYELGAGYGTNTGPRARVQGNWRWVNARGHYAQGEAIVAYREQLFSVAYNIPNFLTPTGTLTLQSGYGLLEPRFTTSNIFTTSAKLVRRRIGWQESLSLSYQRESFTVGVDTGVTNLLIGGASWERTRQNERVFPTRGIRTFLGVQGAERGITGTNSFVQLRASAKVVYGFAPRLRVLARSEIGRTFAHSFHELPPTLRFFTGGDLTVRGYGFLQLGVKDSLGNVIGGPALLVNSLEFDYRILPRWAIAVFTDQGNATERLSLSGLKQTYGFGVRFVAPLGLIRVDAAFNGESRGLPFRLHVSIGPDL